MIYIDITVPRYWKMDKICRQYLNLTSCHQHNGSWHQYLSPTSVTYINGAWLGLLVPNKPNLERGMIKILIWRHLVVKINFQKWCFFDYLGMKIIILYTFISFPIWEVFLIKSRIKIFEFILESVRFGISGAFVFFAHIFATFSQQFAIFCFQNYININKAM